MLAVTGFSQWLSLQDKKIECLGQLESITAFLVQRIPASSLVAGAEKRGTKDFGKSIEQDGNSQFAARRMLTDRLGSCLLIKEGGASCA